MSRTFLSANWEDLIMANYEINPDILIPFLPKNVELDYFNGKTYVSLVGFLFKKTNLFGIPIPFFGSFEEVNLRFYVQRKIGDKIQKGVVFINETVPFTIVAAIANYFYKEHYITIPTKHSIKNTDNQRFIEYAWQKNKKWNTLSVHANNNELPIVSGSMEAFIFERYFGFTKIDGHTTQSYNIHHPKWNVYDINTFAVSCNFDEMYGDSFSELNHAQPQSVFLAAGSGVTVNWKRETF